MFLIKNLTVLYRYDHIFSFESKNKMNGLDFLSQISIISDPRQAWKIEHKLADILFLTITAVIGGAEGWEEIEDFGIDHLELLKTYGDFENGIPVHDTIARVISMISGKSLQSCFATWMKECHEVTKGDVIAIDGKTIKVVTINQNAKA